MREFSGQDRRRQSSRPLSIVVDVGVVCLDSLGERTARLLYLTHNVPSTVAVRVLFHAEARRATELERAIQNGITLPDAAEREGKLNESLLAVPS